MVRKTKDEEKDEKDQSTRNAGVTNADKPAREAASNQAEQERLQRDPPPLVHVDPTTGKPIDKPFTPSSEPNRLTIPGAPDNPTTAGNRDNRGNR